MILGVLWAILKYMKKEKGFLKISGVRDALKICDL